MRPGWALWLLPVAIAEPFPRLLGPPRGFVGGGHPQRAGQIRAANQAVREQELGELALDLSSEGSVGEFKKELQRRIWNEQHHQRELAQFLLTNGLIGRPDLARALRVAAANEASGRTKQARERLSYRHKKQP